MTTDMNKDNPFLELQGSSKSADKPIHDDFSFDGLFESNKENLQHEVNDFVFDQLPETPKSDVSNVADEFRFEAKQPQETIAFTCLKCSAKNDVGFAAISENGHTATCSICNAGMEIVRNSFAQRARQLSREIYCVKCGNQFDHHTLCPSCGYLFPDFFVLINHAEARRQASAMRIARFKQTFSDVGASIKSISLTRTAKVDVGAYVPAGRVIEAEKTPLLTGRLKTLLISFIAIIVVSVSGYFLYQQYLAEQEYVKNYVKALYGIKVGVDSSLAASAKISEEWKATSESRVNFTPRINSDEDAKALKIKTEVDKLMQQLQDGPSKYSQAHAKLVELNAIYANAYMLRNSQRGTYDAYIGSITKADKAFKQTAQELKAILPVKLAKELETAKLRYRGLSGL